MIELGIPQKIFALVDCNSFYASCERVFNGKARKSPVAVLSNNDGCIIARSEEVKKLGIKMADPVFKYYDIIKKNNVMLFSSNFSLYADLSRRVMAILSDYTNKIEIYSIDEAFLDLTHLSVKDLKTYATHLRAHVLQCTDIPVSVGIGNTKTLAKAANKLSKQYSQHKGVLDFTSLTESEIDDRLEMLDIQDVWGIGFQYAQFFKRYGIINAKHLKYVDRKFIQNNLHVVGERIVMELQGVSCIPLEEDVKPKKGILSSKAFSSPVSDYSSMIEAVASYMSRASEKLRSQNCAAKCVSVFIRTNHFNKSIAQYRNSYSLKLPYPTSYTPDLITYAIRCLEHIYIDGYSYSKAGVYLTNIIPDDCIQDELFGNFTTAKFEEKKALMRSVDRINFQYGKDSLFFAAQGIKRNWKMKQTYRSLRYTTRITELLEVN